MAEPGTRSLSARLAASFISSTVPTPSETDSGLLTALRRGIRDGGLAFPIPRLSWIWTPEALRYSYFFQYLSSRWALLTITSARTLLSDRILFLTPSQAILRNRTYFLATPRHPVVFRRHLRALIYALPLALLTYNAWRILLAIHCQTAPDYTFFVQKAGSVAFDQDASTAAFLHGHGAFLHRFTSAALFLTRTSTTQTCLTTAAVPASHEESRIGSYYLLWPFFVCICVNQFVDALASSIEGRPLVREVDMSNFEHSLAFSECEFILSAILGSSDNRQILQHKSTVISLLSLDAPIDILLVSFISCLNHISSSALAITGRRHRFRLLNTAIFAFMYLAVYIWSFTHIIKTPYDHFILMRLPTICIISFVPHALLACCMLACATIFGIALLLVGLSSDPPSPNFSFADRIKHAYNNMQVSAQLSTANFCINWSDDFYAFLLRNGFAILTAASQAILFNEDGRTNIHDMTWLERQRLEQLSAAVTRKFSELDPWVSQDHVSIESFWQGLDDSVAPHSGGGFNQERKGKKDTDGVKATATDGANNRWTQLLTFVRGFLIVMRTINGRITDRLLRRTGLIRYEFFAGMLREIATEHSVDHARRSRQRGSFAGHIDHLDPTRLLDLEQVTRRRLLRGTYQMSEEDIDARLYNLWKSGVRWGDEDTSGDYMSSESVDDDDTTSVISASTNAVSETSTDCDTSGQRTPTQASTTYGLDADNVMDLTHLARLLDPQTEADHTEARMLARHMQASEPVTRSRYKKQELLDKAKILSLGTHHLDNKSQSELEEELERFILERRRTAADRNGAHASWLDGGSGIGQGGPQCVVCQSSPRTILVWPCGCLSLCNDCRVAVGERNFAECLCCRTKVSSFSKLYVP